VIGRRASGTNASSDPVAGLELAALAESGAIASVDILNNEYYVRLRRLAEEQNDDTLARLRARFATLSYGEAIRHVLDAIERAITAVDGPAA
jgi:hypothetical protein